MMTTNKRRCGTSRRAKAKDQETVSRFLLISLTVLVMATLTDSGTAQEEQQPAVHDFRLNPRHVYSVDRLNIESKGLSLQFNDATLIPIETPNGG